jgi:uncharacterized membrane protein
MLTQLDIYAILFVLGLIGIVVVTSVVAPLFWRDVKVEISGMYFYLPVLFFVIFIVVAILYFVMYGVKQSKPDVLNKMRDYASTPALTFLVTLVVGATVVFTSNEVVKRVGIATLGLVACWLITFPNFIRQEMGKTLHKIIDTGDAWTDPVYTGLGVILFGAALVLQYFFVDAMN